MAFPKDQSSWPPNLRTWALNLLRQALGNAAATFKDGQWEAIESVLKGDHLLVVQRTGWGKSIVYFLLTRILRHHAILRDVPSGGASQLDTSSNGPWSSGPTLLICPLLALMRNQLAAAGRIGVRAATINSDNKEEWKEIERELLDDRIDVLLISPERLSNRLFRQEVLGPVVRQSRIGLLAVDEAHCCSCWGHDFRPDYQRILQVIPELSSDIRLLATTATANRQVVDDIESQFQGSLIIQRGPMARASLCLQNISLPDPAAKMVWLEKNLPELAKRGSGIVYVLTVRTAKRIAAWLVKCGLRAEPFTGEMTAEERESLECRLLKNELDALVATNALGMGFDKPDLAFVVHFQIPGSVVHYYQQVGRAGRALESAYGILLSSPDDDDVNEFFIDNALPRPEAIECLLGALKPSPEKVWTVPALETCVNLSKMRLEHTLKLLSVAVPPVVEKVAKGWRYTGKAFCMDTYRAKEQKLRKLRQREQQQMTEYLASDVCLMRFLAEALNDPHPASCGRCEVCRKAPHFPVGLFDQRDLQRAMNFIRGKVDDLVIEPRKKWPDYRPCETYDWVSGKILEAERVESGKALCIWGDPGWGRLVAQGYRDGLFAAELAAALAEMARSWNPSPLPSWVTCIPSSGRPRANPELARQFAEALGIPFFDCIRKVRATESQRDMANNWHRVHNRDGAYVVDLPLQATGPLFLVDDVVDTRWTLTVAGALLRRAGSGRIFPLALAHRR